MKQSQANKAQQSYRCRLRYSGNRLQEQGLASGGQIVHSWIPISWGAIYFLRAGGKVPNTPPSLQQQIPSSLWLRAKTLVVLNKHTHLPHSVVPALNNLQNKRQRIFTKPCACLKTAFSKNLAFLLLLVEAYCELLVEMQKNTILPPALFITQ